MKEYDLVVIGGGPIGSTLAKEVSIKGKSVLIVDRKKNIGYPNHCSGLVSKEFLKVFPIEEELILNHIKGAKVYSYDNNSIHFKSSRDFAVVIDRVNFDIALFNEAISSGADFILGSSIKSFRRESNILVLNLDGEIKDIISAKIVALATGAGSSLKKLFGFSDSVKRIITFQTEEKFEVEDTEITYIYMNNKIARNWFAWVIPLGNGYARIGFGDDMPGQDISHKFSALKEEWELLKRSNLQISKPSVWSIPIGLSKETAIDNCIIVGDAATQNKPFSGGGLYTGMLSAKIASSIICNSIDSNDFSKKTLDKYHESWQRTVGKEIRLEMILREIYENLNDNDRSLIVQNFNIKKLNKIVSKYGIIDLPWKAGFRIAFMGKGILTKYLKNKIQKLFRTSKEAYQE